jgi:YfiH family protein
MRREIDVLKPIQAETLTAIDGIRHGFFTREGGISEGIYAGLNVGLGSDDATDTVLANRQRVAAHLGFPDAKLNTAHQIHSANVLHLTGPLEGILPRADGLVSRTPGVIIGALAADCTPVLFADPVTKVIGAAHAGWRGAVGGILEATIEAMEAIGANRERIAAAVGPTINQANYEVGPEFEADFIARDAANAAFFKRRTPDAKPHFDLPGYVVARLRVQRIASIERQTHCTYADESRFFSYRRSTHRNEPDYGRQISAIVVI